MTAFADVTGGMNPLQSAQALNTAQQGSRDEIDWANKQLLRNLQSAHTNDDGSLDQFGFIHAAASHGVGPDAVKAWLANQNDTYNTATNQSTTNMLLKTLNLNPNALRDQSKLPGQPGAGGMNSIDGEQIPAGQSIQYNNEQGAGAPQGNSTLNLDASPDTSDEVRARAAARAQNGAVPQPTDLDTQTNAMGARASAWGKGSPTTAAIQKQIGLTGSDVDGTWGPKTAAAYKAYLANNPNAGVVQAGSKLQFLQDQTANPNVPTTGDQGTGNGAVGSQTNPAPYVKGEPHYSDTYYGVPGQNGIVPIKGSVQRPAGAAAFTPNQPTAAPSATSTSAGAFAPKPVTGSKAMTSGDDAASLLDTKTEQMTKRATAWGKGSPAVASIQKEIGLTGKDVDGTWGPKTAAAYRKYLQNNPNAGVVPVGTQLQFKSDVGDTTPQVVVNASNPEANSGGTFTAPPPQDNSMSYTATQDKRSILERLADSGSGSPTVPNAGTSGASDDNAKIFNYANVVKTGNLNLKQGVDATLAKMGKSQDQQGVNEILEQAAHGVPVPTPQMKDGRLDVLGYTQEVQAYGAKVIAAKTAAAKALADGNTTALSEILGRDQYSMAKANQEKEFSQVSHPAIKGYLPSPSEKQNLTDASGADKEIISLMQSPPSPNSAEWGAFKLMLGKSIIKGMNLPVGEGMVDAVGQQVQNGANIGDVVKSAANGLAQGGLSAAAANAAATGMVQAYQSALGINSIDGAKYLVKGTSDFIRNKWSAYGKGAEFDSYFPEYKGGVGGPSSGKKTGPGAFIPKKKTGPLSGSSF